MMDLKDISVQYIKGVGPSRSRVLKALGIESVEDLLYFFPRRYEDRTRMTPLGQVEVGAYQTVTGTIMARGGRQTWYSHKHVYETVISDPSGRLFAVWFNQPYLQKYFRVGSQVILYGKVTLYRDRLQMVSPEYEIIEGEDDQSLSTGRIVPVYPLTKGISQRYLRKVIKAGMDKYLDDLSDSLPVALRNKHRLLNIRHSLQAIHFPEDLAAQTQAHRRVSFEEFFFFQLSVIRRRMSIIRRPGVAHAIPPSLIQQYQGIFPFALTRAQQRVIGEIAGDMRQSAPMLRLLQGDVGSGKTLVALFGCLAAIRCGHQAVFMAPTEILARQHYESICRRLQAGPFSDIRVGLLVSGLPRAEKEQLLDRLRSGEIQLLIGTHALLEEGVEFTNLSLVVIDEQHKFGVRQRAVLTSKGTNPDVLVMTATPIPRTLSLTLFGDLDVSTIDELPPGRGRIETRQFGPDQAAEVYRLVRERVEAGSQAYIVYPLVSESDNLDLKAAQAMFARFQRQEFKGLRVGLVHGQMKRAESDQVMARFKANEIQVLVATTVLEVGVDVPNASVMVIEHAERFGLSQLHQLRGRVGRGAADSQCLLIADPSTEEGAARLKAILSSLDGFVIAEQDLLIRGPGQYFGRHQHGLNELRFANPATELDILELARAEVKDLLHLDPWLESPDHAQLLRIIQRRYPTYLAHVQAG